jgi:hypothetical protein
MPGPDEGNPVMLLLVRRRHPAVAIALGLLTTLLTLAYGIATHHQSMLIMGALFLALPFIQITYVLKHHTARDSPQLT